MQKTVSEAAAHEEPAILQLSTQLSAKLTEAENAVESLLSRQNQPREIAASGVAYLMMLGTIGGGWLLLRQGIDAHRQMQEEGADKAFFVNKLASLRLFAALSLPQASAYAQNVIWAGEAVENLSIEALYA